MCVLVFISGCVGVCHILYICWSVCVCGGLCDVPMWCLCVHVVCVCVCGVLCKCLCVSGVFVCESVCQCFWV